MHLDAGHDRIDRGRLVVDRPIAEVPISTILPRMRSGRHFALHHVLGGHVALRVVRG